MGVGCDCLGARGNVTCGVGSDTAGRSVVTCEKSGSDPVTAGAGGATCFDDHKVHCEVGVNVATSVIGVTRDVNSVCETKEISCRTLPPVNTSYVPR